MLTWNRSLTPAERRWIRRRLSRAWGVCIPPDDGPEQNPGPTDMVYDQLIDTADETGETPDQSPRTRGD